MEPFVSRSHFSAEADGCEACVYMQSRRAEHFHWAGQFEQMPSNQASTVYTDGAVCQLQPFVSRGHLSAETIWSEISGPALVKMLSCTASADVDVLAAWEYLVSQGGR
jgi:hypothetical protein